MDSSAWNRGEGSKDQRRTFRAGVNPQESFLFVASVWHAAADYSIPVLLNLNLAAANLEKGLDDVPKRLMGIPERCLLTQVAL